MLLLLDYFSPHSSFSTACWLTHTPTRLHLHTYYYTPAHLLVHTYSPSKVSPAHSLSSSCHFLVTILLLPTCCYTPTFHYAPPSHLPFTSPVSLHTLLHSSLWWLTTPLRQCLQTGALEQLLLLFLLNKSRLKSGSYSVCACMSLCQDLLTMYWVCIETVWSLHCKDLLCLYWVTVA